MKDKVIMEAPNEDAAEDEESGLDNVDLGKEEAPLEKEYERDDEEETLEHHGDEEEETEVANNKQAPDEHEKKTYWMQGVIVLSVHLLFVALAILTHYIYEWSDDSDGAAWAVATDESVVQHLKMMLWPWIVCLVPLDLLSKLFHSRQEESKKEAVHTWYLEKIKASSMLNICQAHLVSLTSSMFFVAGVFRLYTAIADVTDNFPADIVIYIVAISAGPMLRLWLLGRDRLVGWLLSLLFFVIVAGFFVYVTYEARVDEGFWLNSHDSVDHDVD